MSTPVIIVLFLSLIQAIRATISFYASNEYMFWNKQEIYLPAGNYFDTDLAIGTEYDREASPETISYI
jgi:hypothetical protein